MDKERNPDNDDDFDDDDLFEGLSNEDYNKDDKVEEDDLSEGYLHETLEDEESDLYQYQDESGDKPAYGEGASAATSMMDQFKQRFKSGTFSQKIRSLFVPFIFGLLILGFCVYKISGLFAPPTQKPSTPPAGLNVREYIARPQKQSDNLDLSDTDSGAKPAANKSAVPVVPDEKITEGQPAPPVDDSEKKNMSEEANVSTGILNEEKTNEGDDKRIEPEVIAHIVNQDKAAGAAQAKAPVPLLSATAASASTQLDPAITAALSALQTEQAKDKARIQTLETQLSTMADQFTNLNKKLQGSLVALEKQITALNEARLRQQQAEVLNKKAQEEYTVQAIIPGRAWLKTRESKMITVTQGDTIPGYGTVTDIDVENGLVRTSLGAVFTYALGQ
ncbi:MAG: hypothetical protein K0R12_937 [Gammaproteobacteria bacterium]|jgi:hypothetical protein|nr:hypothetical protein [Gammaproteobacteria bacterium]